MWETDASRSALRLSEYHTFFYLFPVRLSMGQIEKDYDLEKPVSMCPFGVVTPMAYMGNHLCSVRSWLSAFLWISIHSFEGASGWNVKFWGCYPIDSHVPCDSHVTLGFCRAGCNALPQRPRRIQWHLPHMHLQDNSHHDINILIHTPLLNKGSHRRELHGVANPKNTEVSNNSMLNNSTIPKHIQSKQ